MAPPFLENASPMMIRPTPLAIFYHTVISLGFSGLAGAEKPLSDSAKFFEEFLPKGRIVTAELRDDEVSYFSAGDTAPQGVKPEKILFEIGSITKVFTGLLLAHAVLDGRVSLDSPLKKLMPNQRFADPRVGQITLLQLATHTSGLPSEADDFQVGADGTDPWARYDRSRLRAWLERVQLEKKESFPVGYSNFGIGLLGDVLAQAYQRSWPDIIQEKITQPLGMSDTVVSLNEEQKMRMAPAHMGENTAKPFGFSALVGAGGLKSTAFDMISFGNALLAPETTPMDDAITLFLRPQTKDGRMGLAIYLGESDGQKSYAHDGATNGYNSVFEVLPQKKLIEVILINNSLMEGRQLIAKSRGKKTRYETPERPVTKEELKAYEGVFIVKDSDYLKGSRFTIVRRENELFGKIIGTPYQEPFLRLCPHLVNDHFFLREREAQYQFARENGQIKALTFSQGGIELHALKTGRRKQDDAD